MKIHFYSNSSTFHSNRTKHLTNSPVFNQFTEGPFQSDALLVPEGCLFDHIHNASRCWPFVRWNQTGAGACQERGMQMRSFAILLPCGISLFSGVEFVCCPKHFKGEFCIYHLHYYKGKEILLVVRCKLAVGESCECYCLASFQRKLLLLTQQWHLPTIYQRARVSTDERFWKIGKTISHQHTHSNRLNVHSPLVAITL